MHINHYFDHYFDDLAFSSLREDLTSLSLKTLKKDFQAGLTVAFLTVPQTMAFAFVTGLPLSSGLFAAIFSAFIASLFGSSRHLVVGPSNAIAMLIQSGLSAVLYTHYRELTGIDKEIMALNILTQLTLLVALIQATFAFCKLGRLTHFVSHSVIVGYLLGVAVAIVVTQLYVFLGISPSIHAYAVYEKLLDVIANLGKAEVPALTTSFLSLFILIFIKKWDKRLPAGALMLALVSFILWSEKKMAFTGFFGIIDPLTEEEAALVPLVGDNGMILSASPVLAFPYFHIKILNELLPFAFAVALLSILESTAVAKAIAASSGQKLSVNQEVLGVSLGNLISCSLAALPVSGSPSRSVLNYEAGAVTRFAALFGALQAGAIVFIFDKFITEIPLPALAALLVVTAFKIVDIKQLKLCLKATSSDAFVLWVTFISCLLFSLDVAFYIGVIISITLYLKKAAMPQLSEFSVDEKGVLQSVDAREAPEQKPIRLIKVEGELFFGAAELFQTTLRAFAHKGKGPCVLILQLKNARDMDATACLALKQLNDYLISKGHHLVACGMMPGVLEVFVDSGIGYEMGEENLFPFDPRYPNRHTQLAWQRANKLVEEDKALNEEKVQNIVPIESIASPVKENEKESLTPDLLNL